MGRRGRLGLLALLLLAWAHMLTGCATGARPPAVPSLSPGPSPSRPLGERTRSVAAFFEVRPDEKYTTFVTAYYDIPLSITSVNAQGEIDDGGPELYFLATASDDRLHQGKTVQVTIDDALTTASVKGSLRIVSCSDEDGKPVTGSRCPIGQRVEVTATWGNAQAMEDIGPADAAGKHVGRGRKCSASATIGSDSYTTQNASGSQLDYGLISEALTYE